MSGYSNTRLISLYAVLINGDYSFVKFNKTLRTFRYRIEIVPLDAFERKFSGIFGLESQSAYLQNLPIRNSDGKRVSDPICISRDMYRCIREKYPAYIGLLEKGYAVLLQTIKTLPVDKTRSSNLKQVEESLQGVAEFAKNFRNCLQAGSADLFMTGMLFAYWTDSNTLIQKID